MFLPDRAYSAVSRRKISNPQVDSWSILVVSGETRVRRSDESAWNVAEVYAGFCALEADQPLGVGSRPIAASAPPPARPVPGRDGYVSGSVHRNVVKRPLTEEEARFYTSEIVAALEWIHLHGYVYR